jgi:hypothetical protein
MKRILNIIIILSILIITSCRSSEKSIIETNRDNFEIIDTSYLYQRHADEYVNNNLYEEDYNSDYEKSLEYPSDDLYNEPNVHAMMIPTTSNIGTLLFNIDSIFVVGVVNRVEAKIVKKEINEVPEYIIELFHVSENGIIKKQEILVGDIMGMKLTSLDNSAFEINNLSSNNQILNENTIAEWVWGVKPIKSGIHSLILIAVIKENNGEKEKVVFDMEIPVLNKPKKDYTYKILTPEYIKKNERGLIDIVIESTNNDGHFKWGGNGDVKLIIEKELDFEIINEGDVNINDNKNYYNFKWSIKPTGKSKELKYHIVIIGDDEQIIISDGVIEIKRNFISSFNIFIDNIIQRWYWLFTTLIIPLYFWIKKRFKKNQNN